MDSKQGDIVEQKKKEQSEIEAITLMEGMNPATRNLMNMTSQVVEAGGRGYTKQDKFQIAAHNSNLMGAEDQIELMLTTQMQAIHNTTMSTITRATYLLKTPDIKLIELGNLTMNTATKLSRAFTNQMEALNRYRGKNQQKMTVEHVNINAGGQAIIGNVKSNKESKGG